jgi:hypothetical protein
MQSKVNIGQYVGLGVGLDEAVEVRNILIFRYMWVFFGISFGLSTVRWGSGPARFFRGENQAQPGPRAARLMQTSNSDHGFLFVFCWNLASLLYRLDIISAFLIAENGGKAISTVRGHVRPEVKSPFDSLTPFWYRSVLEFSSYLSKVIRPFM